MKHTRFGERGEAAVEQETAALSLSRRDALFFVALCLAELSLAAMLTALYTKGERTFEVFLSARPGLVFLGAVVGFLAGGIGILCRYREHKRSPSRQVPMIVAMNLVTVVLILVTGEIVVRAAVYDYFQFKAVGKNLVLKPKSWEATQARYRKLLDQTQRTPSLLVHDDVLGWTVGLNSRGADGLYWSGPEGLRVPHEGAVIPRQTRQVDIAVVGDSYTFGDEVRYEDTYGHFLDQMLGSGFRVLNFGVPGYGLDQMFLRYQKDVRKWKPKIVILGFIDHDLERTLWVYPFLGNHEWDLPFAKPRFIVREDELLHINPSPLPPGEIFAKSSVSELPMIEYQAGYKEDDWIERFYHVSYLVQLFTSRFSPWSVHSDHSEEALLSVNASILRAFVQAVQQDGATPLVVFFPGRREFQEPGSRGKQVLERTGLAYVDPTGCLVEVDPAELMLSGRHYSPQGNAAVAKCVYKTLNETLTQTS